MFKAIYMHTKPLKHTKNFEILTNYIKQKNDFESFIQKSFWPEHRTYQPSRESLDCNSRRLRAEQL